MKLLVTGASGLLGKHVLSNLAGKGVQVVPTDLSGHQLSGSILDKDFVFKTLASVDFDSILHLAAITDIKRTVNDPAMCFEVNCFGTLNMLELGVKKGVKRFIYSSSANVYGAPKVNPVTEEAPTHPRVPYDYSKVIGEALVSSYQKTKGLPTTITRSWLLFGEYDQPNRAVMRFVGACLRDEPITLFNSGRDKTAPSHAMNYAKLVTNILSTEESVGEAFNFGGERALTVKELAELVRKLTGSSSELILAPPRSELESEPQVSYPSTDKARSKLGFSYALSLEEGILRTVDWVKSGSPEFRAS
jgi:nucleoside-diphosphate-sugar epimerase